MPPRKKTPVTFDQWLGHVIDNEARARGGRAAIAGWIGTSEQSVNRRARGEVHVGVRRRGGIHSTGDFTH